MKKNRFHIIFPLLCWSLIYHSNILSQTLKDITNNSGLDQYTSNQRFGTGVSASDFNGDGWIDLHVSTAYGERELIYLNNEGKGFQEVSQSLGLELNAGSVASLWMDYNSDQRQDLVIINSCSGLENCDGIPLQLFRQELDGTFTDATEEASLDIFTREDLDAIKGGLAAADINLDGYLDLIYVNRQNGEIYLLMNNRNGQFLLQNELYGMNGLFENYFQPLIWDFDFDGDPDIYINVDGGPNRFYVAENFQYTEKGEIYGINSNFNEMGLAVADHDNNGSLDLYMTNIDYEGLYGIPHPAKNILYQTEIIGGEIVFNDVAQDLGVDASGWAWGTTFLDINNDGLQDLAATNGVDNLPDPSKFWLNNGNSSFTDISDQIGFNDELDGSSLISMDYDRDGDLDLIQTIKTYEDQVISIRLFENDCESCGNYLTIQPRMVGKNHFGIGTVVKVTANNRTMMRLITAGNSFYGQEPAEAHFGLADESMVDQVQIIWPGGAITTVEDIQANQVITITDSEVLHIPQIFSLMDNFDTIAVVWNHISSIEEGFQIEIAKNPDFANSQIVEVPKEVNTYNYSNDTGKFATFFRIRSFNEDSSSIWSNTRSVGTYIAAPSDLRITNEDIYNPILEWQDNSTNETSFLIEKSEDETFEEKDTFLVAADNHVFQDKNLEWNKTYFYRVAAVLDSIFSPYTNVIQLDIISDTEEISSNDAPRIFPNPAGSYIIVENLKDNMDHLIVTSLTGQLSTIPSLNNGRFDISNLPTGIYFLKVINADRKPGTIRFVKIK